MLDKNMKPAESDSISIDRTCPVYRPMVETLQAKIESGLLKEGQQIPSETELATKYGISRSSVRQGLSQLVKLGKIQKVGGKGTYVRTIRRFRPIESLDSGHRSISLVVPSIDDPFVAKIHSGIIQVLERENYTLSVRSSENATNIEAVNLTQSVDRGNVGIILLPLWGLENAKEVEKLHDQGVPLVLVDRSIPNLSIDCISTDNLRGAILAIDYFVKMGHHRIGMIRGVPNSANDDRYRGYCAALQKHGIDFDETLVVGQEYHDHSHEPVAGGHHEMSALMKQNNRPTAVFASNDVLAFGAEQMAMKMGLKVPDDVSIIGFDDLQHARLATVPLTTIHQPAVEIGQTAAELLIESIKALTTGTKQKIQKIEFIPRLIVRQSVRQLRPE
jgi:DNA-binding LacI/PurR family transcriptional regulator/DNA-binding transcriptional regulator YhcF (GntR family)